MRALTHPRVALVLAIVPMLVACGVLLDVPDDPATAPDRVDGSGEGAVVQEGGPVDPDATRADAGGDACAMAAACAPERLATLSGGVLRLVVAGTSLYAGHMGTSVSQVVSLSSAAPGPVLALDPQATIPDNFGGDSNIAVDSSGAIYWGTPNGLRRREPDAGPDASTDAGVASLSALGSPVAGVRIADGRLHFTVNDPLAVPAPNFGQIRSCALPGCTDLQTAVAVRYPLDVIAIGGLRWWLGATESDATVVFRKIGVVFPGVQNSPSRMATDGQRIFWSTSDALRMFTIGTDTLTDVALTPSGSRFNGVAVDPGGTVYVTQQSNVLRCTLAAGQCSFTTIATTAGTANDVAADATHVYWGTSDGSVWRLRKP